MPQNTIKHLSIPQILTAQRLFYSHKFAEDFHCDENNEIIHIIEGKIRLKFQSGEEYIGGKNDTLFIPQKIYHLDIFESDQVLEAFHINFKWDLADDFFKNAKPDCVKKLPAHAKNEIILLFDMIRMGANPHSNVLTEVRLAHLLGVVWEHVFAAENYNSDADNFSQLLKYAKDYMRANISQDLNIDNVAEYLHISRSTLIRAFRKSSELSFNAYLCSIRMQLAYVLLHERGLNLADCAAKCGFSDPSYFSKVFKKHFGFSPKDCK